MECVQVSTLYAQSFRRYNDPGCMYVWGRVPGVGLFFTPLIGIPVAMTINGPRSTADTRPKHLKWQTMK